MINLGSSARIAPRWNNVDFSWLLRLGRFPKLCALLHRAHLLSPERYERVKRLDRGMVVWDLRRGIPFEDNVFDVVYHSHVLEHIDRTQAKGFLEECRRVLKPGGAIRVVVPDLETLARRYVHALDTLEIPGSKQVRADAVEGMIDQMIVRTPVARLQRPAIVRLVEHLLLGDTDQSGVLHRWMYDRQSLGELLLTSGFDDVHQVDARTSRIAGWNEFLLDLERSGSPSKLDSLYMEASRP
jgi:SAM-dependent methyltransferase